MAHLAAFLAFPLGGDIGSGPFPSGTLLGPPLGAEGSAYGPYFNANYPPGAPYALYPQESLNFLRWMPTPIVDGSTVVDLVMPAGYDYSADWYIVLYSYTTSGTIM